MNKYKHELMDQNIMFFEVALSQKCSMRCNGCMEGCHPDMTKNRDTTYDIKEFENDFKHLSKFYKDNNMFFHLLGGEPFELPNFLDYVRIIRKYFNNAGIDVLNNGVVLYTKSDSYLKEIKELNIVPVVTGYPLYKSIRDKLIQRLNNFNIEHHYHHSDMKEDNKHRDWFMKPLSYTKEFYDQDKNFGSCTSDCVTIYKGNLYSCVTQLSIAGRNYLFGTNYKTSPKAIKDLNSFDDIIEFAKTSSDFCKYCAIGANEFENNDNFRIKWARVSHIDKDAYILEN